jgi:MoaA/NifB/PqqE/SkfB family radical SAM enzyme
MEIIISIALWAKKDLIMKIVIDKHNQDILTGSARLIRRDKFVEDRVSHMLQNIRENKAYKYALERETKKTPDQLAELFAEQFREYRRQWKEQPKSALASGLAGEDLYDHGHVPLCIDIETAAICDLACGFCYRESIATPDKLITDSLFERIVDQAVEIGVPSIKFNWRGEPLMHPRLHRLVDYAKRKGVIDTIINTNATHLSHTTGRRLIEAGLDFMIYSFDGGTKETYERMRPGRFKPNKFEDVYRNIVDFAEVREKMGAKFPRTKIQMILTEETYSEQEAFFKLFDDYVDEVTVTQYSERGGNFSDLDPAEAQVYRQLCDDIGISEGAPYMRDADGKISVANGRLPCEQPFQRLMVTYDGRVAMCCFDWGAMHPVGYVDKASFKDPDADKRLVMKHIQSGRKGFELKLMGRVEMPPKFNQPEQRVDSLKQVWSGEEIALVRRRHIEGKVDEVAICKGCTFKDTYSWVSKK